MPQPRSYWSTGLSIIAAGTALLVCGFSAFAVIIPSNTPDYCDGIGFECGPDMQESTFVGGVSVGGPALVLSIGAQLITLVVMASAGVRSGVHAGVGAVLIGWTLLTVVVVASM
ncbi:hypothetical protein GCM10009661_53670 [Catellatospora chokoriensis]|uniref:Vitamin K epoxide reductase family protein n=1 Tax=Catellatospora chokoriensis TaxID=310353 RepID=A0A8J3JV36_9ACTN|nr:hypothetical protein Cch02nite_50250 [Catellatospora chokoriensis]